TGSYFDLAIESFLEKGDSFFIFYNRFKRFRQAQKIFQESSVVFKIEPSTTSNNLCLFLNH
ncbi:hypothetical protein, partial [Enterococcus faecalis]|uniref:hypothetical protein n=1 Tax=Enterococcus faecalis TaxID=1351 RepID=UPI001AD6B415